MWIAGSVRGTVRIEGLVLVESTGSVEGDITARTIVVRGALIGDATATEIIRIEVGSKMVGDARAPRVGVVEGALFRGQVHLSEDPSLRIPRAAKTTAAGSRAAPRWSSPGTKSAPPETAAVDPQPSIAAPAPAPPLRMPKIGRQRSLRRDEV